MHCQLPIITLWTSSTFSKAKSFLGNFCSSRAMFCNLCSAVQAGKLARTRRKKEAALQNCWRLTSSTKILREPKLDSECAQWLDKSTTTLAVKVEVEDWNRNQPPHQTVLKKDWCSTTKQAQFKLQIETLNCDGAWIRYSHRQAGRQVLYFLFSLFFSDFYYYDCYYYNSKRQKIKCLSICCEIDIFCCCCCWCCFVSLLQRVWLSSSFAAIQYWSI